MPSSHVGDGTVLCKVSRKVVVTDGQSIGCRGTISGRSLSGKSGLSWTDFANSLMPQTKLAASGWHTSACGSHSSILRVRHLLPLFFEFVWFLGAAGPRSGGLHNRLSEVSMFYRSRRCRGSWGFVVSSHEDVRRGGRGVAKFTPVSPMARGSQVYSALCARLWRALPRNIATMDLTQSSSCLMHMQRKRTEALLRSRLRQAPPSCPTALPRPVRGG